MAKRRPRETTAASERDPRQLNLDAHAPPDPPAAMAKRAVARRTVDASGSVKVTASISRTAAEALSERAIREARNLEDVVAEILEREAQP